MEYENMTVAQLKELLREANLPVSGNKSALIERLSQNETTEESPVEVLVEEDEEPPSLRGTKAAKQYVSCLTCPPMCSSLSIFFWVACTCRFVVNHYAGSVAYNVEEFCEKNKDLLAVDLVNLMQGSKSKFFGGCFFCFGR